MSFMSLRESLSRSKAKWKNRLINSWDSASPVRASAHDISDRSRQNNKAWSGWKTLLDILESNAEVFGPLKSAIGALNSCLDISERVYKYQKDHRELREKLGGLLDDLAKHMANPMGPLMTNSIKRLCADLEAEVKTVEEKQARSTRRQLLEAAETPDDIIECYRRIHGNLERLSLNASLSMLGANMRALKAIDERTAETRLAGLVPSMSATYNSSSKDEIGRGSCAPGTRVPQIALLLSWASDPETGRTCWVNGMAGTGKTTIAYTVCTELDKACQLGASFFCSRTIPECRQVKHIIPSIAYQLARFSFPFRCALVEALESDPDAHTRALNIQYERLIVGPLSKVQRSLPTDFIVVIDALDECENENSVGHILDLLLSTQYILPIRFLVSSRPEPEISRRMWSRTDGPDDTRLVLHDLDSDSVRSDIETYMKHELKHIVLTEAQWSGLLERCGVLFIYASTTCRYLEEAYNMDTIGESLSIITGLSPTAVEHSDENAIDELYLTILTAALNKSGVSQANKRRMREVLESVICAAEPMTLDALGGLLQLGSTKQVEGLLQPLRSVLNIQPTTRLVTTLHASFPDFMFSPGRSKSYHCEPGVRHTALSEACLRKIDNVERKFNICDLASSYFLDSEVINLDRVSEEISPALGYACRHWSTHLAFARHESELTDLVGNFFEERLLLWMEVLSLTKRMRYGTEIIQKAEKWCSQQDGLNDVFKLAHDAWQFVSVFASNPVSQSTPHIYVSMLPFWPASRPISKAYMPRAVGMIHPAGTAITRRRLALLATWDVANPRNENYWISVSEDGTRLAATTRDGIVVLDTITGESIYNLSETDDVLSVAVSPDGSSITFGCRSGSVKHWDLRNGDQVTELLPSQDFDSGIQSMTISSDQGRVATGLRNGNLYIYSLQRKELVHGPLEGHTDYVCSIAFSPDGSYLASGSDDKTVRIWDITAGHMVGNALQGHTNWVRSVSYSLDGSRLVSGSNDRTIRVWDPQTGQTVLGPLEGHSHYVLSVAFSPDSRFIASGSRDRTIRVYDAITGQTVLGPLHGHTDWVSLVIFSSDKFRLFSSSDDRTIRVWNVQDLDGPDAPLPSSSLSSPILSVRYSHIGSRVVSGSEDGTIHVWDVQAGNMVLGPLRGHADAIWSVDYSPNDAYIASASGDNTLRIWDASNGNDTLGSIKGHVKDVRCARFSPDSLVLASGSDDGTIRIWDVTSGQQLMTLLDIHDRIHSIGFSPDGRQLVSGSKNGTLHVLDRHTGDAVIGPLQAHSEEISSVEFSPDGLQILSSSSGRTIHIWGVQQEQKSLIGHVPPLKHNGWVFSASFSPDGRFVVSGCGDRTVQVWDAQTGRLILDPLEGHTSWVRCVQFSPDGSHIVSCSEDRTIRFWDVSSSRDQPHRSVNQDESNIDPSTQSVDKTPGSWSLDKDGWVMDRRKRRLVWVPSDLQSCPRLMPRSNTVITDKPLLKLDFNEALLGMGWTGCYRP